MIHRKTAIILVVLLLCERRPALRFDDFDYCTENCVKGLHAGCPQPCYSGHCAFMPATYEFRSNMLRLHNELRDKVAAGTFNNLSQAGDMRALSYDMELEFLAYCWASKRKKDMGMCPCVTKKDANSVGQNEVTTLQNTAQREILQEVFAKWSSNHKSLTPAVINNYQPSMVGKQYPIFTMLIHAETTHLGCARCLQAAKPGKEAETYLTCFYSPTGNVRGSPVYTIGDPVSSCPSGMAANRAYPNLCGSIKMPDEAKYILIERGASNTCNNFTISLGLLINFLSAWLSQTYEK